MQDKERSLSEKIFVQSLATSLLSILLCMACLCAMTWAWFGENSSSASTTIKTANCIVDVTVSHNDGENTLVLTPDVLGAYELKKEIDYTVEISVSGTARSAYCRFAANGKENYTQQIATGSQMIFTMKFTEDTTVILDKYWGESSRENREIYANGNYVDFS